METLLKQVALRKTLTQKPLVAEMVKKMQVLKNECNYTDQQIEATLKAIDMPFGTLLFLLGNYSNLMSLKLN